MTSIHLLEAFVLLVFICKLPAMAAPGLKIRIDITVGRDVSVCLEGRVSCATLTYAFNRAVGNGTTFFFDSVDHFFFQFGTQLSVCHTDEPQ